MVDFILPENVVHYIECNLRLELDLQKWGDEVLPEDQEFKFSNTLAHRQYTFSGQKSGNTFYLKQMSEGPI